MFIEFQHPLLDLRTIIDGSQMISCPNWNEPYEGDAIRFTGIVKSRLKGGISHFKGENLFCTTYRAVRFPNLNDSGTEIEFDNGAFVKNKGLFRHLNSDGEFLVKYESGFGNKFEDFYTKERESPKGVFFKKLLDKSCDVVVQIGIKEKIVTNIIESGPFLAKQYLYSTTKGFDKTTHLEFIKDWWINAGNPMLLVIYFDDDNFIELPDHTITVKEYEFEDVTLYHYWVLKKGKPKIRTWIIKCKSNSDEHFIRQLRLNLLRINAEIEILKLLTITLGKKKDIISKNENTKEKIDEYIEKVSSKLLKKFRYGNEQKDFLKFALEANYHVNPTDVTSYFDTLKVIRNKYAFQNLKNFKDNWFLKTLTMSFENVIEILKLAVSFVTPIIILVLGIIINRKIEKGKLLLLKDKEWQVKWADLFFNEAIVFNNLVTESVSLINKLSNLPPDKTDEINSIIEILSNEKFQMLEKVEWNIKNYVQLSDNKNNIEKLLLLQEEIFREIGNLKNEGSISFDRVRSKQLDYNKLAREIHNEIMNYKK